ncbi:MULTISPECIES: diaminopimelate epimerase [Methylomonas]|uniref:Diaminopimelate epimerase n=1 Tax=Methylomonas koyamae TaxID=702114 RepID=A0A177PH30_9GAMM|nr:diaminopimelate epimerase [Methylomonas koyamae]
MRIHFTKMQGLGNDFVVIDAINQSVRLDARQIRFIADRHFGVGCDQLLLVESPVSENADFKYRIFNADGSEVAQCGNGARCFARFVLDQSLTSKRSIVVDTDAGQLVLNANEDGDITVNMGVPRFEPKQIPLLMPEEALVYTVFLNGDQVTFSALSMGNPHAIICVEDIETAPVSALGKVLESHPLFPERVNVGFMKIMDRQSVKLRVYERGAAETLACGSGACAAAVAGIERGALERVVSVQLPGGSLKIAWQGRGHSVYMTGPAVSVYEGQIEL